MASEEVNLRTILERVQPLEEKLDAVLQHLEQLPDKLEKAEDHPLRTLSVPRPATAESPLPGLG